MPGQVMRVIAVSTCRGSRYRDCPNLLLGTYTQITCSREGHAATSGFFWDVASLWRELGASMRKTTFVGGVLAISAFLVVILGDLLDLKLEPVALLGVALGAVIGLVPDRRPSMRLAGFGIGLVVAWIGFIVRAGLLPDSAAGRAVTVAVVIALVTVVAAASANRLPLWSLLVGAAAMAGAYEYTFAAAPPEVATTSLSTATALLVTAGVGYLVVALTAPRTDAPSATAPRETRSDADAGTPLDDMMETVK